MSKSMRAFGALPAHLDPFGLFGGPVSRMPRLRFADEGGDGSGAGGDGGDGDGGDGADSLGDAGKKALDAMKAERNSAKTALKAFTDLGLTPEQIKALQTDKAGGEAEKVDVEAIEQRIRDSVKAENDDRVARSARNSEVRAQAAELGFVKPAQALALIPAADLEKVKVDEDGEPDKGAVKALLDALAKDSPHLLKPTTVDHRTAGIGSSSSGTQPEVRPGSDRIRQAYANSSTSK